MVLLQTARTILLWRPAGCHLLATMCLRSSISCGPVSAASFSSGMSATRCRHLVASTPDFYPAIVSAFRAHPHNTEVAKNVRRAPLPSRWLPSPHHSHLSPSRCAYTDTVPCFPVQNARPQVVGALAVSAKGCLESVVDANEAGASEAVAAALQQHQSDLQGLIVGLEAVAVLSLGAEGVRRVGEAGCAQTSNPRPSSPCNFLPSRRVRPLAPPLH